MEEIIFFKKIDISKLYFLLVLILGIIISLMLPIGQTPDELVHFKQMTDSFGMSGVYDQYEEAVYSYNLVESAIVGEKIDKAKLAVTEKLLFDKAVVTYNYKFNLQMFSYIPAYLGFMLAYCLNLPICSCLWFAEVFNLLFAAFTGAAALKYMPVKKEMLLAVTLLPMCIHQYASINYDAILLPLCFLLIAVCLYLKIEAEKVTIKDMLLVLLMMFVIATIKPPYALIGFMALGITADKIDIKIGRIDFGKIINKIQNYWYISLIFVIVVGMVGLFVLKDQRYVSLIVTSLLQPVHYLRLLYHTITYYFEFFYISTVGNFGYLSMPFPKVLVWMIYIVLIALAFGKNNYKRDEDKIKSGEKILYLLISFVIFNMVFIAMISHTFLLNGLTYGPLSATMSSYTSIGRIEGVQGRYFIPLLPMLLLCLSDIKLIKGLDKKVLKVITMTYALVMSIASIWIIYIKLW